MHDSHSLADALALDPSVAPPPTIDRLYDYYLATADKEYQQCLAQLRTLRQRQSETRDSIPEIMVMRELPQPRPTYVRKRGAYDAPGDLVQPSTPSALHTVSQAHTTQPTRTGAVAHNAEPPFDRAVAVNRFWQLCFGDGLVRTPEDFGSQGQPPSHPELLDWLARDFIDNGWNVKRLLKQIAMSATYQQTSAVDTESQARDPENRLLGRGPRFQLPAEMLRDNALAVSGLLVDRTGGPPVRPYEVEASFKPAKRDVGDGLYRRSLYTYWRAARRRRR